MVSIQDVANNVEALEVMHSHLGKRIQADRAALEKSHRRTNKARGHHPQVPNHHADLPISKEHPGPWTLNSTIDPMIDTALGSPRIIRISKTAVPQRVCIPVRIDRCLIPIQVDTASDLNVLTLSTVRNLPSSVLSTWSSTVATVEYASGQGRVAGTVTAMVSSPLGDTEQEFYVIENGTVNLLGLPWISDVGLKLNHGDGTLASALTDAVVPFAINMESVASLQSYALSQGPGAQQAEEAFSQEQVESAVDADLTVDQKRQVLDILQENKAFWTHTGVGRCRLLECEIRLTPGAIPIRQPGRRYSPEQCKEISRQVDDLLAVGAIQASQSPWTSQIVMIPKKGGEWRMCVDFREVNKVTTRDAFPLPLIQNLLDALDGARFFIAMDMKAGFHQICMAPASREITAFATPEGLFEYKVMPFGLVNAPAIFQRMAQMVFGDDYGRSCLCYIDDIIIFSRTFEGLMQWFRTCCEHMNAANIYINVRKCKFGFRAINYLGHVISDGKCHPDPNSVAKVQDLKAPTDVASLRRFLGCMGFFRAFIPSFADVARPLTTLLKAGSEFRWRPECQQAFESLRSAMTKEPIYLELPRDQWEYVVDTDASSTSIAGILMQRNPDSLTDLRVLQYASHALTEGEAKWAVQELEAYAIVWSILKFEHYLRDSPFTVRTDHQSLSWLGPVGFILARFQLRYHLPTGNTTKPCGHLHPRPGVTPFGSVD